MPDSTRTTADAKNHQHETFLSVPTPSLSLSPTTFRNLNVCSQRASVLSPSGGVGEVGAPRLPAALCWETPRKSRHWTTTFQGHARNDVEKHDPITVIGRGGVAVVVVLLGSDPLAHENSYRFILGVAVHHRA